MIVLLLRFALLHPVLGYGYAAIVAIIVVENELVATYKFIFCVSSEISRKLLEIPG